MRRKRNVFDDLGFSPEESAALTMKAELHSRIVRCAKNYSQRQLQKILGESQPRVSDLLRGKISKFSLDALVGYAAALDMRPEIKTRQLAVETVGAAR
ncbi:MAG: helix-turn-helix transcriptional regulator [Candidatus Acidiferrales bacterium]